MQEVKLTTEEKAQAHLTVTRTKPDGTVVPAQIEGDIVYEVTQGDATVDATDNANPWIISGESAMESKILATGDADLGAGVTPIVQEFSVIVSFPTATGFNATVDAPVAK